MKLFAAYNRVSITASIIIFLGGCVAFYFVLRFILIHELDKTLATEEEEVMQYVREHNKLPEVLSTTDQKITYRQVLAPLPRSRYRSEKILYPQGKQETIRRLTFGVRAGSQAYDVDVSKSQVEAEDLLQIILWIAVGMIGLILLAGYVINRVVIKRLLRPFYSTIGEVVNYQLSHEHAMNLPRLEIEEFDLLNHSLGLMISRIQEDYRILKDFTGNAAHEMQTPLAVIRSYLEMLQQDEHVLFAHNHSIRHIEESVTRLSRLNQSLLLLARIDNHQFLLNEEVKLEEIVEDKIGELTELIQSQQITLHMDLQPVHIRFHHYLAEVVVSNLLHNAIRYNLQGGTIGVTLQSNRLSVSNTSELPALDRDKIFQRFYRHPDSRMMGNGLGLSIVRQIAAIAMLQVSYEYNNGLHNFCVDF